MTMTRPVASMRIAREISAAEAALDEALIRQSTLFAAMVTARRETDVAPFAGHEALLRLAKSQQSLLNAGGDLARVHGSLLELQTEYCGVDECPPEEKTAATLAVQQAG